VTPSTNLLAAILARIQTVCTRIEGRAAIRDRVDVSRLLDPDEDPLLLLQKVQYKIAQAWNTDVSHQLNRLEPDVAAVEVLKLEGARLGLDKNLNDVLDKLAASYRQGPESDPLFLVSVDDFDLNPVACLPLLRIVRMISCPRLFFLVLGDI